MQHQPSQLQLLQLDTLRPLEKDVLMLVSLHLIQLRCWRKKGFNPCLDSDCFPSLFRVFKQVIAFWSTLNSTTNVFKELVIPWLPLVHSMDFQPTSQPSSKSPSHVPPSTFSILYIHFIHDPRTLSRPFCNAIHTQSIDSPFSISLICLILISDFQTAPVCSSVWSLNLELFNQWGSFSFGSSYEKRWNSSIERKETKYNAEITIQLMGNNSL